MSGTSGSTRSKAHIETLGAIGKSWRDLKERLERVELAGLRCETVRTARRSATRLESALDAGDIEEARSAVEAAREVIQKAEKEQARLDQALLRIVGSTRRAQRTKNLVEVAREIQVGESLLGSSKALAARVQLSPEMLRQFKSVGKLSKDVRRMVEDGPLTSVDAAYRISLLPKRQQMPVARAHVQGNLSGKDVREVVALWKRATTTDIGKIIEQVKSGRASVEYVVRFADSGGTPLNEVRRRFERLLGKETLRSIQMDGRVIELNVDQIGRDRLRMAARERGVTNRRLVQLIIGGSD